VILGLVILYMQANYGCLVQGRHSQWSGRWGWGWLST